MRACVCVLCILKCWPPNVCVCLSVILCVFSCTPSKCIFAILQWGPDSKPHLTSRVVYYLRTIKPNQVNKVGMSMDYGLCKGKRKDGQPCTMPVNKTEGGGYCEFHVVAAFNRAQRKDPLKNRSKAGTGSNSSSNNSIISKLSGAAGMIHASLVKYSRRGYNSQQLVPVCLEEPLWVNVRVDTKSTTVVTVDARPPAAFEGADAPLVSPTSSFDRPNAPRAHRFARRVICRNPRV